MADSLQIRGGRKEKMPNLMIRELVYCTDEQALYIGTAEGNVKLCSAVLERIVATHNANIVSLTQRLEDKLTASKVTAQAQVASDASTAAIATAFNNLIAAMKDSGVMKT